MQGWEFVHWFSERITRFLQKKRVNERCAQKNSDSLIFVERPELTSLIFGEQPEQFAHIAQQK